MSLRNEKVSSTEIVISRKRYAQLLSMEFRYQGYLRSTEYMGLLQLRHAKMMRDAAAHKDVAVCQTEAVYHLGYLDAIKTMGDVQLRMVQQVLDAHPDHDVSNPGRFRKGQLCLVDKNGCYCLVVARESEGERQQFTPSYIADEGVVT